MTHSGKVAMVTGAAAGIGQAIAVALAQNGATVVGLDLADATDTRQQVEAAGSAWLGLECDVSSPEQVDAVVRSAMETFSKVDILVNNAGIYPFCTFEDLTLEEWRRIFAINLESQFLMSRAVVPSMKASGWGRIVNLTSGSVQLASENLTAYKASKMGAIGLTRGMASDLGRYGITVNAASPSLARTPGVLSYGAAGSLDRISEVQAIKRVSEANDIVGLILFLTSEASHFVTGQTIFADGGLTYA